MNIYSFLKPLGFILHDVISKSKVTTKIYISLLSIVFRRIPAYKTKQRVINSINSINWLDIDLAPCTIKLGSSNHTLKIIPHFHEFDFEALFNTNLSYEKEVFSCLEPRLINYDTIIEIGANVGIFSLFFASSSQVYNKKQDIFIFEPSREAYLRLLQNLKLNNIKNIQSFNCAIGDKIEFLNFYEPEGHLTNGSLDYNFTKSFSQSISINKTLVIDGRMLEKLVEKSERTLIKIDTEGSEYSVLSSLESIITKNKIDLVIEVLPDYQNELNSLEFLFAKNYSFLNITKDGLVKQENFLSNEFRDYILLLPED